MYEGRESEGVRVDNEGEESEGVRIGGEATSSL